MRYSIKPSQTSSTIAPIRHYTYLLVADWAEDHPAAARRISSTLSGWQTIRTRIRILLVIHSMTAAARLADLIPIFQDPRMQLFCTQTCGSMFPDGIGPFIRHHGFYLLTWEQAKVLQFDAVICASLGDNLHEIANLPILRIPHGNGYNKRWISDQRSAISDQRSAISDQRSAISLWLVRGDAEI
jgi:hypothetical protein